QGEAAVSLLGLYLTVSRNGKPDAQRGNTGPEMRSGVHCQQMLPFAYQCPDALVNDLLRPLRDGCIVTLGVGVHPRDGTARQDVVELLEEDELPQLLQLGG